MDKYSSDSDSKSIQRNNKKSHLRICQDRSSSSDSSSSKTRRRKNKKHRRDRSKSKGTDTFSKFRNEGSRYKSHSTNSPERSSRSLKDRYRTKHKTFNSGFTRSRSISKDRSTKTKKSASRDSSRHREKSDNSSSSNSCSEKNVSHRIKEIHADKVTETNEQIKLKSKKEKSGADNTRINSDILGEINDDGFIPKQFVSTNVGKKMSCNIVIDLKSQIIKIPDVEITEPDSIFHPNLFTNEETRMEKWAKELYVYRQKTVNSDLNI